MPKNDSIHYSIQKFQENSIQKNIQFKNLQENSIQKNIQLKKFNSKKYSIQKFAKKFNSKFDSKCWIWQDSIQQYIHSITKHGYRSPLGSMIQYDLKFPIVAGISPSNLKDREVQHKKEQWYWMSKFC